MQQLGQTGLPAVSSMLLSVASAGPCYFRRREYSGFLPREENFSQGRFFGCKPFSRAISLPKIRKRPQFSSKVAGFPISERAKSHLHQPAEPAAQPGLVSLAHRALWPVHAARTRPSGSELAGLCFPPHHGRGECCKRMIVQAHRVAFALAGKTQDATCELIRPHLVIAVAPERQPSLVERCFQGCERLGIERSTTKSTHVSSPEQGSCWNRFDPIIPTMWPTL